MAVWNYVIEVTHVDQDGVASPTVMVGGPHDLAFSAIQGTLEFALTELPVLEGDPNAVRLKLTLRDKP
ncbi:MAG: hypothetical protein QM757_17170 [Paludibaculum sp.]